MEFHVARAVRDKYGIDELLFGYSGNVVFANVAASRAMAKQINDVRAAKGETTPAESINAGALFAMGLIDELSHAMVAKYRATVDPEVLRAALEWFAANEEPKRVEALLAEFTDRFPNVAVYRGQTTVSAWLAESTEGMQNREVATEELLLLWLANINPAFVPFRELFDDRGLKQDTVYGSVITGFGEYIETRPPFGELGTLLDVLRAPMLASPDSLMGQLAYIRENWVEQLGVDLKRLLLASDVLSEEEVAIWMRFHPDATRGRHGARGGGWGAEGFEGDEFVGFGPGGRDRAQSSEQPALNEYEAFSQDQDWMPTVVLIAKSTYVWLEQLSQKYERHIHRLDQIPEEELKLLADRGLNGLWLIGLWERSVASQTIKRLRGQHDAVASAYSLKDYRIAEDLGGNGAYEVLRDRASKVGIRLASDMVPNHMGIDSTWVTEHPDWFISRPESPFPVYSFEGPDLSTESRYEIKIEDHYYDQTDAAVAFRLRERSTGRTQYVYHGNDGTTFAWNDTAQLDYSKAYVREQVIQVILSVARQFPIIRFDAAMVLAKKHVQRLWFPLPGLGGSIPSRAEDAISQEEFDALMPNEFWREVVDRVAEEVPGTLLLAEAFWLLEGYFVRTLGMHRVYNSAFMNMLRDEENAKYRSYLKKTIEFDPDILKRYVNFMSNPDERTAIDQFGTGDKYFGVSTLLATLPGLPMFGHGQVEGFTEKYGMEYKQARMREFANRDLVARHQREIAPLLKKRWAFAESSNFVLYDFWNEHGTVDENVFAYSNVSGGERSLVIYNNVYGSTRGTVHTSAASMDKGSGTLRQRSLADAMQLPGDGAAVLAYKDTTSGLEYLRRAGGLLDEGFTVELRGYQYVVLQEWREMRSTAEQPWDRLCDALGGSGVHNLEESLSKLRLRPVHDALRELLRPELLRSLVEVAAETMGNPGAEAARVVALPEMAKGKGKKGGATKRVGAVEDVALDARLEEVRRCAEVFLKKAGELRGSDALEEHLSAGLGKSLRAMVRLPGLESGSPTWPAEAASILPGAESAGLGAVTWGTILAWTVLRHVAANGNGVQTFDELQLRSELADIFSGLGVTGEDAWRSAARVRLLLGETRAAQEAETPGETEAFWAEGDVRWLTSVNESGGAVYFNKEAFEQLLWWMEIAALIERSEAEAVAPEAFAEVKQRIAAAATAAAAAGYEVRRYVASVSELKRVAGAGRSSVEEGAGGGRGGAGRFAESKANTKVGGGKALQEEKVERLAAGGAKGSKPKKAAGVGTRKGSRSPSKD